MNEGSYANMNDYLTACFWVLLVMLLWFLISLVWGLLRAASGYEAQAGCKPFYIANASMAFIFSVLSVSFYLGFMSSEALLPNLASAGISLMIPFFSFHCARSIFFFKQ